MAFGHLDLGHLVIPSILISGSIHHLGHSLNLNPRSAWYSKKLLYQNVAFLNSNLNILFVHAKECFTSNKLYIEVKKGFIWEFIILHQINAHIVSNPEYLTQFICFLSVKYATSIPVVYILFLNNPTT